MENMQRPLLDIFIFTGIPFLASIDIMPSLHDLEFCINFGASFSSLYS